MKNSVVVVMQLEPFGELEYEKLTKKFHRPELPSTRYTGRATIRCHRGSDHGGQWERWRGVGAFARGALTNVEYWGEEGWDLPVYGLGGWLGNYWSTRSGIEVWDKDLFKIQANTMTELVGAR